MSLAWRGDRERRSEYVRRVRGVLRGAGVLLLLVLSFAAVLLTTARLVEPSGAQWLRAEAFTPYALPMYAVLLLVALLGLVRGRGAGRGLWGLAALLAVAGLGAHTAWFLPQVSGPAPAASADAPRLTVMTVNQAAGLADPVALLSSATAATADLLVVQEITEATVRRLEEAGLDEVFPERAGQPIDGEFGTMVFSRLDLGEGRPLQGSVGSLAVPVSVGRERLEVVAVHAQPPTDARAWREQQQIVGDHVRGARPDLVVGDLNATADHAPMRSLARAGYRSVTELANEGWRPTWPSSYRLLGVVPVPPLVQIDHVLCGPTMTALRSRTVMIEGSDHRAVVAEVAVR